MVPVRFRPGKNDFRKLPLASTTAHRLGVCGQKRQGWSDIDSQWVYLFSLVLSFLGLFHRRGLLKKEFLEIDIQAAIKCREAPQRDKRLSVPDSISGSIACDSQEKCSPVRSSPASGSPLPNRQSRATVLETLVRKQATQLSLQRKGANRASTGNLFVDPGEECANGGKETAPATTSVRRVQSQHDQMQHAYVPVCKAFM